MNLNSVNTIKGTPTVKVMKLCPPLSLISKTSAIGSPDFKVYRVPFLLRKRLTGCVQKRREGKHFESLMALN